MTEEPELEALFERYVERHVADGTRLDAATLCDGRPELVGPLRSRIERYHDLDRALTAGLDAAVEAAEPGPAPLPVFEGFRTIERLGCGGMGEVFKAHDLRLDRIVAIKVLRATDAATARYADFLREARALALFADRRIVQIHEFRADHAPPFLVMEFVDGFELDAVGRSLEPAQRARIMVEVCEAVERAHERGIQHRDLKPANVLVDATLSPKILDFGLADDAPLRGHLVGTLPYLAPEQLEPGTPLDARTDVYALGVVFYELLCGSRPYEGRDADEVLAAIRAGRPRLPVEIEPTVPEPLQAVALQAMECDPARRYASAREMALDLRRYLDGRPVLARPSLYATALGQRLRPHLEQIREWERLRLVYPHEAAQLARAYGRLEAREDDWIVESRVLSFSQIALYLGAFLLVSGGLLYFGAHRVFEAVEGLWQPALVLGLPFVGLNLAARLLYLRGHRAVSIAFCLAGLLLLPLLLLIALHETGFLAAAPGDPRQLLGAEVVSNRQLQVALALACAWAAGLAVRTRTAGLASFAVGLSALTGLAVLADFGLREWIEAARWDRFGMHLLPLLALEIAAGAALERARQDWLGRAAYVAAGVLGIAALELVALDGRAFQALGLSMARFQASEVADPVLLDTLAAMTINGVLFYLAGWAAEGSGSPCMRPAAWVLVVLSPFATLYPASHLVATGAYSPRYDWLYLALALGVTLLSRYRQRKSFYFAGLLNTGVALWYAGLHREWLDDPAWAIAVIVAGLVVLGAGFAAAVRDRRRAAPGAGGSA